MKYQNITSTICFNEDTQDYIAESDEIRIKQIILNFISNAVKFMKYGNIELRCKPKKLENKFFIKISVKDNGIGIKEADKAKLFKDFGMIENEGKIINNHFGSGLGLSICKSISYRLGLKLNFNSEHMKGSKFYILIPCRKKEILNNKINNSLIFFLDEKSSQENEELKNIISFSSKSIPNNEKNIIDEKSIYIQDSLARISISESIDKSLKKEYMEFNFINCEQNIRVKNLNLFISLISLKNLF